MPFLVLLGVCHVFTARLGLGLDFWHFRLLHVAPFSTWACLSSRVAQRGREWKRLGVLNVWAQKSENVLCILLVRTVMGCAWIHRKGVQALPVDEHRDMYTENCRIICRIIWGLLWGPATTSVFWSITFVASDYSQATRHYHESVYVLTLDYVALHIEVPPEWNCAHWKAWSSLLSFRVTPEWGTE